MLAKEKALEIAAQAPAGDIAPVPDGHLTYIIADAPCQAPDADIVPLSEIERRLREAAEKRLTDARHTLQDARDRIDSERGARVQQLSELQTRLNDLQEQLSGLANQRALFEQRARVFLTAQERERTLEQIHLTFNARQFDLEVSCEQMQRDLDVLESEHQAALLAEGLELQLLQGDIETLEQAAPDIAVQVQLSLEVALHLGNAIQLANQGLTVEAESELALARAGGASESKLATAETALNEAQRRSTVRELVAQIQAVQTETPGAVSHLKQLRQEAQQRNVVANVEPFLNRALKLARVAASARYRDASLHADHLASQGLVPTIGDGRIEAWQCNGKGWMLIEVWTFQDGTWIGHQPRVRLTRSETPRRVRRSRWYRQATNDEGQTMNENGSRSSFVIGQPSPDAA